MDLRAYLERIGYHGPTDVDHETLRGIHRSHVLSVPFENIDVLLGRRVDFDVERIFEKVVTRRRGGWCYEMNGLFAWAMETIGFEITRMAAGVGRSTNGDEQVGNHLVLLVDGRWVADVGFGDGLFEPVALEEADISDRGFHASLESEGAWWRYRNSTGDDFDFKAEMADPRLLAEKCDYLQSSPDSFFTKDLVIARQFPDHIEVLRNTILSAYWPGTSERLVITEEASFVSLIREHFGLEDSEIDRLWPQAHARGEAFLASQDA